MDLIARPGGYGLNSEGYGCGTLADVCDYSTYFSGSIKAGGGVADIITACATVGLCTTDLSDRFYSVC